MEEIKDGRDGRQMGQNTGDKEKTEESERMEDRRKHGGDG